MEIRKYLFWMTDKGIKTYKTAGKGDFELIKFRGEDIYADSDLVKFAEWFNKMASIAADEYIDFCYLSDKPVDFPEVSYGTRAKSSWNRQEISLFCDRYVNIENYEIVIDAGHRFTCQSGNIYDESAIKRIYLKCVPEFVLESETVTKTDSGLGETSLVNKYFIDMLRELDK